MKFIVVGASGFIGRHALSYLKSQGYEALGTQSKNKSPDLIKFNLLEDKIKHCIKDTFLKNENVFGVICASVCQLDLCKNEKSLSYKVNVEKTLQLIEDFVELGITPLFFSSSFVYDGVRGNYSEEDAHNPISEYGTHKSIMEKYINNEIDKGLVFRIDKIIGTDPEESHLFSEWYKSIKAGKPIICIKDQFFCPTLVEDVAKSILIGCEKNLTGVYNVANTEIISREKLAEKFLYNLGVQNEIICKNQKELGFADLRPLNSYLNSTKFIKDTQIQFANTDKAIKEFINNLRQ